MIAHSNELMRKELASTEGLPASLNFQPDVGALDRGLLAQLPRLLGQRGVSDTACARAAACVKLVVLCAPACKPAMLQGLEQELQGCAPAIQPNACIYHALFFISSPGCCRPHASRCSEH